MKDRVDWEARAKAIAESRRSLWSGLGCTAMTCILLYLLGVEFSQANDLLTNGKQATAVATYDSRTVHGRKGRVSYATPILLDGITTTVALSFKVAAGDRLRIVYNAGALAHWSSHKKGLFHSYMVGDTSMSAGDLVERKLGDTYTFGRWVIAAFGLLGAYLLWEFYRTRKKLRQMWRWE